MHELVIDSWCKKFDLDNVILFIGGHLNYHLAHAKVLFCPHFFWSTTDFYRTVTDILPKLSDINASKY